MRSLFWILGGIAALLALTMLAISVGATSISMDTIIQAIGVEFFGFTAQDGPQTLSKIIVDLRLPRALLGLLVGAGLGVVGCLLQTVTRNDLADPFLFGLSSGAATGAVLVITITGDVIGIWTLPLAAFCGGVLASIIVLALVARSENDGPARLVLAGLAVSFLFMAITNYMVFAGDQRAAHSVLFWTLGGLGLARWELLPIAVIGFLIVLTFSLMKHRQFDALLAGEDTAKTLGVDVKLLRRLTFLICAFATAAFVSLTGVIGFVGLMVPHLARALVGPLHRNLIILASTIGAGLLLLSDIAARTILIPQELPIGIVTTSIGAVFVLAVLRRL